MCRRRRILVAALLFLAVIKLSAETMAVSVRLASAPEEEGGTEPLLASVEEGAMEAMFAAGHIVFDIDVEGATPATRFQAIDLARAGGAAYLILVDTDLELVTGRGLMVAAARVTVVDVESERDTSSAVIDAGSLPGADEATPVALALDLGTRAAGDVLRGLKEANTAW